MLQDGSIQKCMYVCHTSRKVESPHGNLKESVLPFILKNRCWLVTLTYSSWNSVAVLEFNDAGSLTDHRLCAALSTLGLLALTSTFQCLEMRQANHVVRIGYFMLFSQLMGVLRCKYCIYIYSMRSGWFFDPTDFNDLVEQLYYRKNHGISKLVVWRSQSRLDWSIHNNTRIVWLLYIFLVLQREGGGREGTDWKTGYFFK